MCIIHQFSFLNLHLMANSMPLTRISGCNLASIGLVARGFVFAALMLFLVAAVGFWLSPARHSLPTGVSKKEYQLATEAFQARYGRDASRIDILSWLAEWYLSQQKFQEAIHCFAEIPTSHSEYGHMARYQQGRTLLSLHQAVEAERQFRELITAELELPQIKPRYLVDARQRLRHILEVELRFEERKELLRETVLRGDADFFEVVAYCFPSHLRWNGPDAVRWLEEFHAVDKSDPSIRVALGRYRMGQGKLDEARRLLESVVTDRPDDRGATAALIACLRESDDQAELARRFALLPPLAADDPWLLLIQRGQVANDQNRSADAIAAFEMLLKQDPTSSEAWAGLSQAFLISNDLERRKRALVMSSVLGRIQNNLGKIFREPREPESYLFVLDLCAEIDLIDEGLILSEFAGRLAPDNPKVIAAAKLFQGKAATRRSNPASGSQN